MNKKIIQEKNIEINEKKIIQKIDNNKQSNVDIILQKWSRLQKIIKEEIILKKVIIEQQKLDFSKLKSNFIEYYNIKLKIREIYEDIEFIKKQKLVNKQIIFEKNVNYNNKIKSISELLFIYRNNFDYVVKLCEIIESNNKNNNNNESLINSIAELLCNQFYDNILIPNPEQKELLILTYKLIEKDICQMGTIISVDNFLGKNTFIYKFIRYLMRKPEIKIFLSKLLGPLFLAIEKYSDDLDLFQKEENNKEENEIFLKYIKNFEKKENITEKKIKEKIEKINDNELKNYFLKEVFVKHNKSIFFKLWKNDINIYSLFNDVNENEQKNLIKLKNNFLFLKDKIDFLLKSFIEKLTKGPYIIKCICKIIFLLITKNYPSNQNYIYYSFISKFIFENCIFPALNFEDNNLIENKIYNSKTKYILQTMSDILSKAVNYTFFNEEKTPIHILFNYYFLDMFPLLREIHKKIIDVRLPNFLNFLIEKKIGNIESNKNKKYNYFKENIDEIIYLQSICISADDILYILDIISKNLKEFEHLDDYINFENSFNKIYQGNEKDIVNIMSHPNKNVFFILFNEVYKSKINKILKYYYKKRTFPLLNEPEQEEKMNFKKIKLCIKKVLRNLNEINSKNYSILNFASSNAKFLTIIKNTIDDSENNQLLNIETNYKTKNNDKHIILLKWYGQYINNNKNCLEKSYTENDFEKLYNEILKEELENLNKLQLYTELIIERDGMNLICSEKIIEKTKNDLIKCEISRKFLKIEKFIDTQKIEVCFRILNDKLKKEIKSKKKKLKKQNKEDIEIYLDENPPIILLSEDLTFCNHKKMEDIECLILKNKKVLPSHSHDIKEFILKFSDVPWGIDKFNKDKKPKDIIIDDINNGTRNVQIFKTMNYYMDIIKKRINNKEDIDDMIQIIQNFIYRQIYKYIYPKLPLKQDIEFYNKTLLLDWITPENLEIQKFYVDQLTDAELCIKKFDNVESIFDKLNYIKQAFTNINNNIKYSSGKTEEAGQDEILPIFQYILIRSCPKRMKTNLNYINCFLSEDDYDSQSGYFLSQLESSYTFIMKIGYKELNISKDIYEENIKKSKRIHCIV